MKRLFYIAMAICILTTAWAVYHVVYELQFDPWRERYLEARSKSAYDAATSGRLVAAFTPITSFVDTTKHTQLKVTDAWAELSARQATGAFAIEHRSTRYQYCLALQGGDVRGYRKTWCIAGSKDWTLDLDSTGTRATFESEVILKEQVFEICECDSTWYSCQPGRVIGTIVLRKNDTRFTQPTSVFGYRL